MAKTNDGKSIFDEGTASTCEQPKKLFNTSGGQAAELVGISKRTFIELLGEYNVSVFGYDSTELLEDLENVK